MTLSLPLDTLWAFLLVLARVSGMVAFLPLPAFRALPVTVRVVLSLVITLALFPAWPPLPAAVPGLATLTLWAVAEAGFGLLAGLAVAFLVEGMQMGMQIVGLQAGYGYASMVDPSSEADSSVLQVVMMLASGLLLFATGVDRELIRILALSLESHPAGSWALAATHLDGVVRLSGTMLTMGLRLALPVTALLLLIDVALALLGRMQQQLQLLTLAFPVKMLAALALLAVMAPMISRLFAVFAERTLSFLRLALPEAMAE
jgi:flagellar biosynthetic protein FliR